MLFKILYLLISWSLSFFYDNGAYLANNHTLRRILELKYEAK
jgi:hypothetical protein